MSANEYMETVTGFSASLLQSLGGDTQKAAEKADTAIRDMSDNANKMGTDIESIQNAYQGFAKQNYTMLDNLKLGYGGTKEEMERLLDEFLLTGKLKNKVYQLSGGEQQRLALIKLIIKDCDIILADEPTGSLDASNRDLVMHKLLQMNQQHKTINEDEINQNDAGCTDDSYDGHARSHARSIERHGDLVDWLQIPLARGLGGLARRGS